MSRHKHKWEILSYSINEICFACFKCKESIIRKPNKIESAWIKKYNKSNIHTKPENDVHRVWHKFINKFTESTTGPMQWKCIGHTLEKSVEVFAKRYPNDVHITSCDDDFFCGSSLVFIEHKSSTSYMGVSVVYVPQCTGENPICFFLYPCHANELINVLKLLIGNRKSFISIEREHARKHTENMNEIFIFPDE